MKINNTSSSVAADVDSEAGDAPDAARDSAAGLSILQRIAQGDKDAFDLCVERYGRLVEYIVRRRMPFASADWDDAVQDALVALWRAAGNFDPARGAEKAYVSAVVGNRVSDLCRRSASRVRPATLAAEPMDARSAEDDGLHGGLGRSANDMADDVSAVLGRIDPAHRHLVELAVLHEKTHKEISMLTGLPLGTVKSKIARTLARLRADLLMRATAA